MNDNMILVALSVKAAKTPTTGVNLCEIDDFDFPPHDLLLFEHFPEVKAARTAAATIHGDRAKLVLIRANGDGERIASKR